MAVHRDRVGRDRRGVGPAANHQRRNTLGGDECLTGPIEDHDGVVSLQHLEDRGNGLLERITTTLGYDTNKLVANRTVIDFPLHATQIAITYEAQVKG